MELRPAIQIQVVIKAMTDVVLPALDPENKLAQEQGKLVVGMLNVLAQRLPLMYRFDRDELARSLALVDNLRDQVKQIPAASDALQAVERCAESGQDVLTRAQADPSEIEATNVALREKIGALIAAVYAHDDMASLSHVSKTITAHAKDQLSRDRAWVALLGIDPDAKTLPAIETLI